MLQIDRLNRCAEPNGVGCMSYRETQPHRIAEALTVQTRKAALFDLRRQLDGLGAPPWDGGEGHGGQAFGYWLNLGNSVAS